jgi:hypothetical protein
MVLRKLITQKKNHNNKEGASPNWHLPQTRESHVYAPSGDENQIGPNAEKWLKIFQNDGDSIEWWSEKK